LIGFWRGRLRRCCAVSQKYLGAFKMATSDEIKDNMMTHMANVHKIIGDSTKEYFDRFRRNVYITSKSYLSFIANYKQVYSTSVSTVQKLAEAINSGLDKMRQAEEDIAKMKIDLAAKEIVLVEAQQGVGRVAEGNHSIDCKGGEEEK